MILLLCLAVAVAAGCGSSNSKKEPAQTSTSAPASDVTGSDLQRLPKAAAPSTGAPIPGEAKRADQAAYLRSVFDDAQSLWRREFAAAGLRYSPATLTIFNGEVHTGCGTETAAVGPFYCPADSGVYLDKSFFDAMARRFNVTGDLARAYVIAHEVAHHVQTELRITHRKVALDKQDPAGTNARSVQNEWSGWLPPITANTSGDRTAPR